MKLTIGFSPCPNDTFIFDALVNGKIDTGELAFDPVLKDVETLNQWALEGKLDITKLSFPAFFRSLEHYTLLDSGAAIGKGAGPLLIGDRDQELTTEEINQASIAIPGLHTTANLLFSYVYPEATDKHFMVFSEIESALLDKKTDLGVIIHENRFTYQAKGLHKISDLGADWEERTKLPVPLGGIAVNQGIKRNLALRINELVKKSVEFAFSNYPALAPYVKEHAQEMDEEVMRQHIDLYVNNYSLDIGGEGHSAIEAMYQVFLEIHNLEADDEDVLFIL